VAFNKKIQDIYQSESLVALRGENDNYKLNGRELLTWTSDVVRPNQVAYSLGSKYY